MANLFNSQPQPQQPDMRQQIMQNPRAYVNQIKSDPSGFLRQFGLNIPQGMTNPMQIIQYLYGNPPQNFPSKRGFP